MPTADPTTASPPPAERTDLHTVRHQYGISRTGPS